MDDRAFQALVVSLLEKILSQLETMTVLLERLAGDKARESTGKKK